MSFHEADSELSRLNRAACRTPIRVSAHTKAVLEKALEIARASNGLFDPTIAPVLVKHGFLPHPGGENPEATASWKDIVLASDGTVAFARPLWIDLGGIAKGYAVDCAIAHIEAHNPASVCVEAGGDLRLAGRSAETVYLAARQSETELPLLQIENAAVASSGSQPLASDERREAFVSPHIDTRTGRPCPTDRFATVVAPRCIDADALTKVLMVVGAGATPILAGYQARGFLLDGASWTIVGEAV